MNDVWNLDEILVRYPNLNAMIYNRWGNIVWRSKGPYGKSTSGTNVWFGQLEGSNDNVPDGVYYYLLDLEDDLKTSKTGFIELMRQ
jgi:gliding motility-associated-like protein